MNPVIIALQFIFFSCTSCNKAATPEKELVKTEIVSTTIADLRKSYVRENIIYRTSDNGGGDWTYDVMDATSQDNTGTVLLTQSGQRLKRVSQGPINVKWFGAKGDSITDETDVFNKALAAAKSQKQSLYIPAGVYSCNKLDKFKHILTFDAANTNQISVYGDGYNSKITTSVTSGSTLLYIFAYGKSFNLSIKHLFFESTHAPTNNSNQGIFLQGIKGENFKNVVITASKFEGFSTAIGGQGLEGAEISNNVFNAPRGHDDAENNTKPAVFIFLYDNQNGYCSDVKILTNNANGYSGTKPLSSLVTRRPMDGLIVGSGYGYLISGNKTRNFSEEHITVTIPTTFPKTNKQIIITNNVLDCAIPKGSMNQDGTAHSANYGIRCDAGNATISNNTFLNFSTGIIVRTYDFPFAKESVFNISNNIFQVSQSQSENLVSRGISVQGSANNRLHNVIIKENQIIINNVKAGNSFSAILMYDSDSAYVFNNTIKIANLLNANSKVNFGISYGRVSRVTDQTNTITGITPYHILLNTDQVSFITH